MLCADDFVLFAENASQVQKGLYILQEYCTTLKLKDYTNKNNGIQKRREITFSSKVLL